MKEQLPFKTWVHHEDYHITLVFLGEAPFTKVQDVKTEMKKIAANHPAFTLKLSGLGYFGRQESPRIFWAGVDVSLQLTRLQKDIYEACERLGFMLEKRAYHPHMTLARRWGGEYEFPQGSLSDMMQPKDEHLEMKVENIVLYQTHLNRSPKYQPLSIFSLGENKG